MGLFDREVDEIKNPVKDHNFISGNIGDLLSDLEKNKQNTGVDEDEGLDDIVNEEREQQSQQEPMQKLGARKDVSDVAGSSMALMADALIPVLIAIVLQDDPDRYKCDDDEFDALEKACSDFTRLQGVEMPPWLVLGGTVLSIFGYKAYSGSRLNKLEAENKRLQDLVDKQDKTE